MIRKLLPILLTVLTIQTSSAQTVASADHVGQQMLFDRYFNWLQTGEGDSLFNHSNQHIQDQMPPVLLSGIYASLAARSGELTEASKWSVHQKDGFWYGIRELQFADAQVRFFLTLDADKKIAGINFVPVIQNLTKPDYIQERHLLVRSGRFRLQATLTMPKDMPEDESPVPVVVLVHGFGPQDMNATVGSSKPFQELAWAFAKNGIATLRYDKRTYAYGSSWADPDLPQDYDTETVDDALAAIRQVAQYQGIDPDRIYLLGHCLGGMLAPRIARRAGKQTLAGIILMNAPGQSIQVKTDSVRNNRSALSGGLFSTQVALHQIPTHQQSEEYRKAASRYRIKKDVRKLPCPVLVLQGGQDKQTTEADFKLWQQLFRQNPTATFRFYPNLNHLMQNAPHEKTHPGIHPERVDPQVIQDITAFILK